MLKVLLLILLRLADGSRVSDTAVVLVQEPCDVVHIPVFESLDKRVYELELRGIGGFRASHRDEGILGGLLR